MQDEVCLDLRIIVDMDKEYEGIITGKAPFGLFVKVKTLGQGLIKTNYLKKIGMKIHEFRKGEKICVDVVSIEKGLQKIVFKLAKT